MRFVCAVVVVAFVVGCGGGRKSSGDGDGGVVACAPEGANQCAGASWQTCQGGMWVTAVDCPMACADGIGCVQCQPGTQYCNGLDVVSCDQNGTPGTVIQTCAGVDTCVNGACVDACMDAASSRSYIACEYWAADLPNALEVLGAAPATGTCAQVYGLPTGAGVVETLNVCFASVGIRQYFAGTCDPPSGSCPTGYTCTSKSVCALDAQHAPFAIIISNPQAKAATVTVTGPNGTQLMQTVAAGQVVPILPQMNNTIPDESIGGPGVGSEHSKKGYKITSDLPIVAYQFNPLDNTANAFSNDASLLIPATTWDLDYYVMTWPTSDNRNPAPGMQPWYGYLTVVANTDNTIVEVTPSVAIQASATQTTIAAGTATQFTLNAFDILNLEAAAPGDLTGTTIHAVNGIPFGVFGGQEAMYFGETAAPDTTHTLGPCCADHVEEMLFPKSTWGKTFALTKSQARSNPDGTTTLTMAQTPDLVRIMAQKPNTAITFDPAPAVMVAGDCTNLQPGQYCDVKIAADTGVSSTEPILVGHYLESSIWCTPQGNPPHCAAGSIIGDGDPSMAIAVPVEQYRTDYTILVPNAYTYNYLSISAAPTGGVLVDGTQVSGLAPYASNLYRAARVPVMQGQHTIHCPDGCGVEVYGYSDAVSYMYAGGLDLKQIVIQ